MSRPGDWWVLDLGRDPTPGEPYDIRTLARQVQRVADDARGAERDVRSLAGDGAVTAWIGLAGDVFRGALEDFPAQLGQLADSYGQCASALTGFAGELDTAQDSADRALEQGRAARAEIDSLQGQLASARGSASAASRTASDLGRAPAAGVDPPDPAQVRAATRNAQAAAGRVSSLSSALGSAQARLEAAKRMARDAEDLRNDAGDRAKRRLYDASDAGIAPKSRWERFKDGLAQVWDITIKVAKVVVAILGIVALIIGGPIAWIVVGLSVLIVADALMKVRNGEGGWLDVAVAALGLIPGTRGLTTLGAVKTAFGRGGLLGVGRHLGRTGAELFANGARGARSMWQGRRAIPTMLRQLPFSAAGRVADMTAELRYGVPGALRGFASGFGDGSGVVGRLRTGFTSLGEGFADAKTAFADAVEAGRLPAVSARAWQRESGSSYPGLDRWRAGSPLPAGADLEALYPGMKGFVFPAGTIDDLGRDASRLSEAGQVGPARPDGVQILNPYRGDGVRLQTTTEITPAVSTARANSQYGPGGADQMFIPNFGDRVHADDILVLDAQGSRVQTFVDSRGGVWIEDVDGGTIPLTGLDVRPGVWDPDAFGADRQAVLDGLRPVIDVVKYPVGLTTRVDRLVDR